MAIAFASADSAATPLYVLGPDDLAPWLEHQPQHVADWVVRCGFTGGLGQTLFMPIKEEAIALVGFGTLAARNRGRFQLSTAATALPEGVYALANTLPTADTEELALGWLLAGYQFSRYRAQGRPAAQLMAPQGIDADLMLAMAQGEALTRDLINTPANDMGPEALHQAVTDLAAQHGASVNAIVGEALLVQNFPMIHTVGRAADQAPRLLDMHWGSEGPKLTLVGKGVCFDTGGLNLKPGASMGLMKKDMGGAATVLGLAHMIMALGLPIQLRVLIPAVENSVAGDAFRPQDILNSRKGLTVEINNTDAEGRLVLADALALADEGSPDLLISMATLTGAARVAVGPDLAPYFTDDAAMATALESAAPGAFDPVWRMPFHDPYEPMIEPGIADLDNAPKGGFAGCITAALFLRRFVDASPYVHFDIYGWNPSAAPARPKGGVGQGARAILAALPARLAL